MKSVDAYIYIIIGILGVAYPILLQVVSHLNEKYSSELITELFKKEREYNAFRYALFSSLFFVGLWSFKLPPLIHLNDPFSVIIENSGEILIILNTIILVISFFMYVRKVLIYYSQTDLISHLIKRHNESQS